MLYRSHKIIKKIKSRILSRYKNTTNKLPISKRIYRAFSFTLPTDGSLTVEAALVFPIAFLLFIGFFYYFQIMRFEMGVQKVVTETGQNWAKVMGCASAGEELIQDATGNFDLADVQEILSGTALSAYLYRNSQSELSSYFMDKDEIAGISDFSVWLSSYSPDTDVGTMTVQYRGNLPWLPSIFSSSIITQTGNFRSWVGKTMTEEETYVYMTFSGKVYHLYADCTYIKKTIKKYPASQSDEIRNCIGQSYSECSLCGSSPLLTRTYIYVTDYGTKYHYDSACSAISHEIRTLTLKEAMEAGYPLCSKCAKRAE